MLHSLRARSADFEVAVFALVNEPARPRLAVAAGPADQVAVRLDHGERVGTGVCHLCR